jgi:DNA polymerase-3 subunit gamma/tau
MENFIVSARKYRPTTFDNVVGQQSITSTLKNAIKSSHLAQAFLFTGPRGVGKTTCARILAKTINCFSISDKIEACNECDSCKSFDEGRSLNIYELDAASNNSVDDIRGLIEQVRFAPQIGTHKVYIIDEVHMLSQAAFNAFLKTLEEPPKHAIFILATTERHKIIPTILSRCQVFDFNRIQIDDISKQLNDIATKESITAEMDGLHVIAQKADGAMRDALSMFDQIVSFSGNNITYQNVIENLNILDYDYYFKVTDAILNRNISTCLLSFNEILEHGFDGHLFINGLAEHFRNLLVCQDAATIQLMEVGDKIKEKYLAQAKLANLNQLVSALEITSKNDVQYKSSKNQRLLVEVMLMQLCSLGGEQEKKKS